MQMSTNQEEENNTGSNQVNTNQNQTANDQPQQVNNINNQSQEQSQSSVKGAKLLIIEDDELLVKMYSTKCSMEGLQVDTALDGEEALEKLEKNDYDMILLDLMLPKVDGFEVLEKLRASSWPNAKKPVIVFSNLGQQSDIDRAKKLGANDYLVKANLTPNQVIEKLREYMK